MSDEQYSAPFAQCDIDDVQCSDDCIALVEDRETDRVAVIFRTDDLFDALALEPVFEIVSRELAEMIWRHCDFMDANDDIDEKLIARIQSRVKVELRKLGFIS